jgi:hypothetical protein
MAAAAAAAVGVRDVSGVKVAPHEARALGMRASAGWEAGTFSSSLIPFGDSCCFNFFNF